MYCLVFSPTKAKNKIPVLKFATTMLTIFHSADITLCSPVVGVGLGFEVN